VLAMPEYHPPLAGRDALRLDFNENTFAPSPAVIAAVHAGLPVFAMSVITDIGIREEENTITHQEVLQAAKDAAPKFSAIFKEMILAV